MRLLVNFFRRHVMYHYYMWLARRETKACGGDPFASGKTYLMQAMSARMGGTTVRRRMK
jgi:hypothetical protein